MFREFEDIVGSRENGQIYRETKIDLETAQKNCENSRRFVLGCLSSSGLKYIIT